MNKVNIFPVSDENLNDSIKRWESFLFPLGLNASGPEIGTLTDFMCRLKSANEGLNLISFKSDEELWLSHGLDSLTALLGVAETPWDGPGASARCIDIGTGGGFPGMPLLCARPAWSMALVESILKKASFLMATAKDMRLTQCQVLHERAEVLGQDAKHREKYDLAFCRAVGSFSTILELALPFLAKGGYLVTHRGAEGRHEAQKADKALKALGGRLSGLVEYQLPHRNQKHYIVRIEKIASTPPLYPRRAGVPAKKPL